MSAPAQVYQNYGLTARFGCSGALGNYCDAFVDQQSGDASTITANRNLSISAGSVANTGSLVTAGSQASITAVAGITNQDQTLNAYWHDRRWAPVLGTGSVPDNFGCGTVVNCASLFGSDYHAGAGIQPPTPYASLPGTIQAPSLSVTAGGQLQNSGNVMGQQVALTGATIVNGLTSPAVYTPQATASQQVISLGPVGTPVAATKAANLASGTGQIGAGLATVSATAGTIASASSGALGSALGSGAGAVAAVTGNSVSVPASPTSASVASVPATPPVQTVAGAAAGTTGTATYLVSSPASQVMGSIGPAQLVASQPASLRPDTTQFYYDPFTEDQVLQQAALTQTGQASFISGLSFDNRNQISVANQEKQVLYGNAIQYAKANNLALGTALTQAQIAALDAPMLWYVEETVPQPGCTATGNASCPTVTALMPQVYLPQNYAVVQHDGTITGQDVSLTATGGGSILNTGSITATDTLTVNGGTLTNQQRSTDIGTQYTFLGSVAGLLTTTGTEVQPGGFMSAGNYQMNVDAVNQIGGALQKLNADGTVDTAGTQQELAALKAQLGNSFTQGTVSNDLHTTFTSLADTGGAFQQVGMLFVMVVASVITAGAASAAIGSGAAAGSTFAAGTAATTTAEGVFMPAISAGLGNMALSAGIAGMTSSALGQAATGSFSTASMLQAGGIAMVTAGLTNGITVGGESLASLAGVQNVGGALVPMAGSTTAGTLLEQGAAIAAEATVQAGVQTAIGGGSFLTNLKNDAISDIAAAGAYAIGNANAAGDFGTGAQGELGYVAVHAALGCAASAASGTGCASGAIGGAASAAFSPDFIKAIDPTGAPLDLGQQAALGAFATLAGGVLAGLAGVNVNGAATAAQNEAWNNAGADPHVAGTVQTGGLATNLWNVAQGTMTWLGNGAASLGNQFIGLVKAGAQAKMSESPSSLAAQGVANGLNAVAGMGGGEPPAASPGAVLVNSAAGQSVSAAPGASGYVPNTATLSSGGGSDETQGDSRSTTSNGTANAATGPKLTDDLAAAMSKPTVSDTKLGGLMDDLYRDGAKIGTGSTADAVRYETETGTPVGGVFHTQKAVDYSVALQRWLDSNPNASFSDRSAAQNVLRDLQNALKGK
ncbi:hypothetical protein B2G74_00445 [Burkholderia sp. A27]|nr:hypothetical protein B2G74_00445 [Burkholderia sp. A27]